MIAWLSLLVALLQWFLLRAYSAKIAWITSSFTLVISLTLFVADPALLAMKRQVNALWLSTTLSSDQADPQSGPESEQERIQAYTRYVENIEAMVNQHAQWPRLRYTKARAFEQMGDDKAAIAILHDIYSVSQSESEVGYFLAQLLLEQKDTVDEIQVESLLSNIKRLEGSTYALEMLYAQLYRGKDDIDKSIASLHRALELTTNEQTKFQVMQLIALLEAENSDFEPINVSLSWSGIIGNEATLKLSAVLVQGPQIPLAVYEVKMTQALLDQGTIDIGLSLAHQVVPSFNLAMANNRGETVKFEAELMNVNETLWGFNVVSLSDEIKQIRIELQPVE